MTMKLEKDNLGEPTNITLRHRGSAGLRVLIDYDGNQVGLAPGEVKEDVKVSEAEAERLRDHSERGIGDLEVEGAEADEPEERAPEEHQSRHALEKAERERSDEGKKVEREELKSRAKPRRASEPPRRSAAKGKDDDKSKSK